MEEYLRIGLLALAGIIVFLIIFETYLRRRRHKLAKMSFANVATGYSQDRDPFVGGCQITLPKTEKAAISTSTQAIDSKDAFIALSVFAKPNSTFASYDLLHAISATGMQFGEMNIFHYYDATPEGRVKLFSLASATKPGHFNLDKIGELTCIGLTLFMDLQAVADPESAFQTMLQTAEQLAEDLDGELFAAPNRPLTSEIMHSYQQKIQYLRG